MVRAAVITFAFLTVFAIANALPAPARNDSDASRTEEPTQQAQQKTDGAAKADTEREHSDADQLANFTTPQVADVSK